LLGDEQTATVYMTIKCPYGNIGDTLTIKDTDIRLKITNIRLERLQTITEEDTRAEGYDELQEGVKFWGNGVHFPSLWDEFYFDIGFGWFTNPWVWVIEFVREEK